MDSPGWGGGGGRGGRFYNSPGFYRGGGGPRRPWRHPGHPHGHHHSPRNFGPFHGGGHGHHDHGQGSHPFASTPNQPHPYSHRRPFKRHFHQQNRFEGGNNDISAWISPAMWEDPWKELIEGPQPRQTNYPQHDDSEIILDDTEEGSDLASETADTRSSVLQNDTGNTLFDTTASSDLDVSDMIMRSALDEGGNLSTTNPLPNITLDDGGQPVMTEANLESKEAKDLLDLIRS